MAPNSETGSSESGSELDRKAVFAIVRDNLAEILEREICGATTAHITAILDRAAARGELDPGYSAQAAADLTTALVTTPLLLRADGPAAVAGLVPGQLVATVLATLPRPAAAGR